MTELPDKLVVVGMRFVSKAPQALENMRLYTEVSLHSDYSEHGVDGWCWKVKYKNTLIGYVRNKDIPLLPTAESTKEIHAYELVKIRENYIVLARPALMTSPVIVPRLVHRALNAVGATTHLTEENIFSNTSKEPKMNVQNLKNQIFREVKNVAIDIQTGKLGFQNAEGIATYQDGVVSVNPIVDFGVKVPAFAMRVPIADLNAGDIIIQGDTAHFFHRHTEQGYEVASLSGEIKQVGSVTNMFFGANTVLAVKNMFGSSNMNPMIMAMMLGEEKEGFDMKTFALMSMMGNQTGDQNNMQQMMMMAMLMNK